MEGAFLPVSRLPPDKGPHPGHNTPGRPRTISPDKSPLTERAQVTQLRSRHFSRRREANIEFNFLATTSNNQRIDQNLPPNLRLLWVEQQQCFSTTEGPLSESASVRGRGFVHGASVLPSLVPLDTIYVMLKSEGDRSKISVTERKMLVKWSVLPRVRAV